MYNPIYNQLKNGHSCGFVEPISHVVPMGNPMGNPLEMAAN